MFASLFGVGAPEALVIGVVALLVFGPKGLAEVIFFFFFISLDAWFLFILYFRRMITKNVNENSSIFNWKL